MGGPVTSFLRILRDNRFEVGALVLSAGVLLTVFSTTQYVWPHESPAFLQAIHRAIGNFVFWEVILGALLLFGGGYYFVDSVRKAREFNRLLATTSKETFLRNRKRIEELAYQHLPHEYVTRLVKKKRELRIRD